MARRRNPVVQWTLTSMALACIKIGGWLPLPVLRIGGRLLGRIAYYIVPRVRSVGLANLDLAYGDTLSEAEKIEILRGACQNLGMVAMEFAHMPRGPEYADAGVIRAEGLENIDRTRGALVISGHMGNWELGSCVFKDWDPRPIALVRSFDDPRLDAVVSNYRRVGGYEPLPKGEAGPEVIRLLREGKIVVILVDQSPRTNGVPVTFFGKPCWATVAPAMIALRTKAPIHMSACIRNEDGTYTVRFTPPIATDRTGNFREDLVRITQQCQDSFEEFVRQHPDQWLWLHRRWKARPNLEKEWEKRRARDKGAARAGNE